MQHGSCFVCLLCSWRKEGTTYICQPFCGTANNPDHCLILWSERSLNPTELIQDCLCPQPKTRKSVAMAIVDRYCKKSNQIQSVQGYEIHKYICKSKKQKESDAVATFVASYCGKLISSNPCRGMECKEPIKLFRSSRNKKVLPCTVKKTSQLSSMQGFGMQRTYKNTYI